MARVGRIKTQVLPGAPRAIFMTIRGRLLEPVLVDGKSNHEIAKELARLANRMLRRIRREDEAPWVEFGGEA